MATKAAAVFERRLNTLRAFDRSHPVFVKSGTLGGDGQDSNFETAFSSLSHAFLADKAPTLMDYEQGFQLLDRTDDNRRAVGVMAFKVGQRQFLAPVFFLQGALKGHELLYDQSSDMFIPLKENWVNYLLNRKPNTIGKGVHRNTSQIGVTWPDLNALAMSPHFKYSAAIKPEFRAFLPVLAATVGSNPAASLRKAAATLQEHGRIFDLPTFLKQANLATLECFINTCRTYPSVAAAVQQHHGLDFLSGAIKSAGQRARQTAAGITSVLDSVRRTTQIGGSVLDVQHPTKTGELKVLTYDATQQTELPEGLTEEDQEKLLKETVLIKDKRDPQKTSIAYNTQVEQRLFNPTETGLYMVLVKPGEFEKCFVAISPVGPNGRVRFATIVRVGDQANWLNTHPTRIWATSRIEGEEFTKWFDGLTTAKTLSAGKSRYMLLGPRENATLPFRVEESLGDEQGGNTYEVDFSDYASKGESIYDTGRRSWEDSISDDYSRYSDGQRIHLNGKQGTKLRSSRGDVWVPEGYKLLTCKQDKFEIDVENGDMPGCCSSDGGQSETPPIQPGNILDAELSVIQKTAMIGSLLSHQQSQCVGITQSQATAEPPPLQLGTPRDGELAIFQKTAELRVYHSGTECDINGSRMTPLAGLIHLVRDHGLAEGPAREILKSAQLKRKFSCRIKYAEPYLTGQGPAAPSYPALQMAGENYMGAAVPSYGPQDVEVPIPDLSAQTTNREIYNPRTDRDSRVGDAAQLQQAANSGQKEVFDTAMIGSLLKAVRDDNMIDRYLPDLLKAVDRLGRIMFMFYWHQDKFAERYGKADMPELEDMIRNDFEQTGDLVLYLKQKSIDPYPEDDRGGSDLDKATD